MDELLRRATAAEIRTWYASGELRPTEFTEATLGLQAETEPTLHAFVTVTADLAMDQARAAECRIRALGAAAWDGCPLLGVPVSVKDLVPMAGVRTTRGSVRTADWVPGEDAPAVARLRGAGAVLIGKTTTSEGGWSAGTVNPLGPPAANPRDPRRSAGGSSGGAAAATAAGIGVAALGTDGAGSIRIPAAFCGVVGFKPTFGRAPYAPVSPEGLSHIGPIARDVVTARLVADVISGPHPADPLSAALPPCPGFADRPRVAWLRWPDGGTEPERVARAAASALGEVSEVDIPFADPYPDLVTVLAAFDAGQDPDDDALSDQHRMRVVEHGRSLTAADLAAALSRRVLLRGAVDALFGAYDVLAMPTVWIEPFAVDAWRPDPGGDDLGWLAWCRAAYPFNLTGNPAVSMPAGTTAAGYPVGLQLVARHGADAELLRVAELFEQTRPWCDRGPGRDTVRW